MASKFDKHLDRFAAAHGDEMKKDSENARAASERFVKTGSYKAKALKKKTKHGTAMWKLPGKSKAPDGQ